MFKIKSAPRMAAGIRRMPECYSLTVCRHVVLEQPSEITGETLAAKSITVTNNTPAMTKEITRLWN